MSASLKMIVVTTTLMLGMASIGIAQSIQDPHHPADQTTAQAGPPSGMGPGMMYGGPQRCPNGGCPGYGGMMGGPGQPPWAGQGMGMGGGMMSMMGMMTDPGVMIEHVDGRIAFLKTELKITDQQLALWNRFADALRENATTMNQIMANMMASYNAPKTAVERLELREQWLTVHIDALHKTKAVLEPLYVALTDDQKKMADALLAMPMMGGHGMM